MSIFLYTYLDSILLNCCIDDIERFCAKLKNLPKPTSHGRNGDEMLIDDSHVAKKDQYNASDFVAIFQKFKLAFNLLVCEVEFQL